MGQTPIKKFLGFFGLERNEKTLIFKMTGAVFTAIVIQGGQKTERQTIG
jgi:hypothetical protein